MDCYWRKGNSILFQWKYSMMNDDGSQVDTGTPGVLCYVRGVEPRDDK